MRNLFGIRFLLLFSVGKFANRCFGSQDEVKVSKCIYLFKNC